MSAVGGAHVLIVAKAELVHGGAGVPATAEAKQASAAVPKAEEAAAKTPATALKSAAGVLAKGSPYTGAATPANHPTPPSAGWCDGRAGGCRTPWLLLILCRSAAAGLPLLQSSTPAESACLRADISQHSSQPETCHGCRAEKVAGVSASKRPLQPISALNPYNNNWAVKAKVVNKGLKRRCVAHTWSALDLPYCFCTSPYFFVQTSPLASTYPCPRSFSRGSVFTAEIVDDQGTAIEATFWRDAADRAYDVLEEGKVRCLRRRAARRWFM